MKTKAIIGSLGLTVGLTIGTAQAGTVSSQFFNGFQQLSDNSAEYLINCTPGTTGCNSTSLTDTTVDMGDRLRGIFDIQTIEQNGVTHDIGSNGNDELSGIFDLVVTSAVNVGGGVYTFTFAPSGALGSGIAIQLYDDPTPDYTRTGSNTIAQDEALATNGTLWAELTSVFWSALSTQGNDIAAFHTLPNPTTGGFYNAGLNIVTNNTGLTFGLVNCLNNTQVNFCGTGNLIGIGGQTTPFDAFDNVDFSVNVTRVPEPVSLMLVGVGLLAAGATIRRRKS